jgi:Xaa-Pro aminopeptidase
VVDFSTDLPASEVQERIARTRRAVADRAMGGLLAYADALRTANVGYFTDFRPLDGISDIAMSVMLLPLDDDPTLFVGNSCLAWAEGVTNFRVKALSELPDAVARWAANDRNAEPLGLAGGAFIPARLQQRIEAALGSRRLQLTDALARVKAVKSEWEVQQLRRAAELTDTAMAAIQAALKDGPRTERELARIADVAMIEAGADAVGYRSMVQAGPRSAYNLALPTDRWLQPGDLVLTDIGARYRGYVADGGRGFGYGAIDVKRQAIIEASASAVEAGLEALRPGMSATALNEIIQGSLVESGFAEYSTEGRGHGTGHGTGMDPEEELPWIGPGESMLLEPNMVFTLKATITVPEVGGVRTERIVRVTESGCETLDNYPMRLNF